MSTIPTTKKMPVSLGKNGEPTSRSEFLIPSLDGSKQNEFIGIKNGIENKIGIISYIGVEINSEDILSKISDNITVNDNAKELVDEFIIQLNQFKIGNVISISYNKYGDFRLSKEAERPKGKGLKRKLP